MASRSATARLAQILETAAAGRCDWCGRDGRAVYHDGLSLICINHNGCTPPTNDPPEPINGYHQLALPL